ncbi:hypothetical protein BCR42DRAFT_403198 [Absidia repens]|uniref:Uncharacterized protein n=1 Tax=Absidia repens TaxID=90262 RepID=A0A1X2IYZ2_9FUNG|nr:hypothetical protein BCR42DRAFT_403198 [Absidia repens]
MLLYLLSFATLYFYTFAKVIIILLLTYSGGVFIITTLNSNYDQESLTATLDVQHSQIQPTSQTKQKVPVSPCAPDKPNHTDFSPNAPTNNNDHIVSTYPPEHLDNIVLAHTSELLDTLYEEKESPASLTLDNTKKDMKYEDDNYRKADVSLSCTAIKNDMMPPLSLKTSPTPTPSLSSPPSVDSSRYFRRRSTTPSLALSISTDDFTRTPPLDLSPSISISTTASHMEYQCLTPTPSCSTTSTSSLRQSRRNSRVGQLVQQFEIRRLEPSSSTPIIKPDMIYPGSISRVTDTIAALHKYKDNTSSKSKPKPPRPASINTKVATAVSTFSAFPSAHSSTQCQSPMNITPSTSTRAIDHRSIGFRPVFATWENRISEVKSTVVPSPSISTPIWSSSSSSSSSRT